MLNSLDENAFQYSFVVEEPGKRPVGILTEVNPEGVEHSGRFSLHGSGKWTTQEENPAQTQPRVFTSRFDALNLGSFMVGVVPGASLGDRLVFDQSGQEITRIDIE